MLIQRLRCSIAAYPRPKVAWEYPSDAQQGYNFIALLAAIRLHLPEDQFTLTAALPASKLILQYIDFTQAREYLDQLNLMAYDFFGPWSSRSGHHAQLYSMNREETSGSSGVGHLISHGFPARKILLGIPTHGRSFLHAAGPGHRFRGGGGDDGSFEYHQLPRTGCTEMVDKRHVAATCLGGDGGFVTYDNPETVKTKAGFCKQKGLAVSLWSGIAMASLPLPPLPFCPDDSSLYVLDGFLWLSACCTLSVGGLNYWLRPLPTLYLVLPLAGVGMEGVDEAKMTSLTLAFNRVSSTGMAPRTQRKGLEASSLRGFVHFTHLRAWWASSASPDSTSNIYTFLSQLL